MYRIFEIEIKEQKKKKQYRATKTNETEPNDVGHAQHTHCLLSLWIVFSKHRVQFRYLNHLYANAKF